MANPEKKFQNKMKRINNKVKKLFETGAIKKFVGLQLKRLYNKSEKSNISIFMYFMLLTTYAVLLTNLMLTNLI